MTVTQSLRLGAIAAPGRYSSAHCCALSSPIAGAQGGWRQWQIRGNTYAAFNSTWLAADFR